jgi:hypothetical protein
MGRSLIVGASMASTARGRSIVFASMGSTTMDFNDVVTGTSLGGINIRMLGFVIQVRIYTF